MHPQAFAAFAAEFPNDNSELHLGTIWIAESVCGPAEAHLPAASGGGENHDLVDEAEENEPIEIVESIVLEGPIELVPLPADSRVRGCEVVVTAAEESEAVEDDGPEVVAVCLISTAPPPIRDAFEGFLQSLSDVACELGATFAASEIGAALAADPVAEAWRAILNGESEDFSACATPLDEWAAGRLAQIIGAPQKAAAIRRDLRAHGIAAFGLIEAA